MKTFELSEKELILLYMLLKQKQISDPLPKSLLLSRIEKKLFDFMTIDEIENIEEYYRAL